MKIEKLELTEDNFLKVLPKLKKYDPVLTRTGFIRFGRRNKGYNMCPLTAYRKEIIGIAGNITNADYYFSNERLAGKIIDAADGGPWCDSNLRKEMLKKLGLEYETA